MVLWTFRYARSAPKLSGVDFRRAAALGERPKRARHGRMTRKHHADKNSRAQRGVQAMTQQRCREEIHCCFALRQSVLRCAPDKPAAIARRAVLLNYVLNRAQGSLKLALPCW